MIILTCQNHHWHRNLRSVRVFPHFIANFWNGNQAIPMQRPFLNQNYHTIEVQAGPFICQFFFLFVKKQMCICINGPGCHHICLLFSDNKKHPLLILRPTLSRYYIFTNILKALFWVYIIIPINVDPRINRGCF